MIYVVIAALAAIGAASMASPPCRAGRHDTRPAIGAVGNLQRTGAVIRIAARQHTAAPASSQPNRTGDLPSQRIVTGKRSGGDVRSGPPPGAASSGTR